MVFREVQTFRGMWWFWLVSLPICALSAWGIFSVWQDGSPAIISTCTIAILLCLVLAALRLSCTLDQEKISISFFPFPSRSVPWTQVRSVFIRKFDTSEFKATTSSSPSKNNYTSGKGYFLAAGYGLQLVTHEGERILIGTRKPGLLQDFLKQLGKI